MEWTNELTIEFLDLYEKETAIWDPKDQLHRNRDIVFDSWKKIKDSMSIPVDIKELKKKKESLMSTFRPLLAKKKASNKSGAGTDHIFKPSWFAYEKMESFLKSVYERRDTINTEVS